jgi:hypothetical protein
MKLNLRPLVQARFNFGLKIILSFWIVYHLLGILIMPSIQSIIVKEKGWIFRTYLNQIGFNTTWNLFSPDPATALFMKVKLVQRPLENGEEVEAIDLMLPTFGDEINWDPTKRRGLYMMRYALLDSDKTYRFLIPWYCRNYPQTQEIYIEGVGTRIPGIEQARIEKLYKISELRTRQTIKEYRGQCGE